ncbi:hypothetical protein L1987_16390 [Smallanthus sonchifolius]|uniref:Uncharacterized protein n=1 Tax=Smallanthus sonchifolius TaxID=185202 RepID=A0ACB9JBQ1_9ASTR|nr:hypothetical protein L1987_16390 [Smallanthus sonchifolius]
MIASKVSFSYTNEHVTEERFMQKIMKNKVEDDELGIFGAEKYFKGVIDEERLRTSNNGVRCGSNRPQEKHEEPEPEPCPMPKPKTLSSVHSESSWDSRRGLLVGKGPNGNNRSKKTSVKSLLASLGCNCSDKGSVKITEAKQPVKGGDSGQKPKSLSSKRADEDVTIKREDCFTFPVLNPSMANVKYPGLPKTIREQELEQEQEGVKFVSLEKKLTMLNWDGSTPRPEILDISRNGGQDDTGSDGSSDLFEIESFSTNENNLFLAGQAIENNIYAPSEASVDWSVATASVADFSTPENLTVSKNVKGSGILSGCTSLKAVRISGDEHSMTSGGKVAVIVSPARREWCNRLDSATPVAKIQADTKLICAGSGLHISQNGFGVARPVHRTQSTHVSSHHMYMKQ